MDRIIWSSFANSNITEMKARVPSAEVAQLFAEPGRLEESEEEKDFIYPKPSKDVYMQFTEKNLKKYGFGSSGISAAHPCIDGLMTDEGRAAIQYCAQNGIGIRTWALLEKDPSKDFPASAEAKRRILAAVGLKKDYPSLTIDIITDYPKAIEDIIAEDNPEMVLCCTGRGTKGAGAKRPSSLSLI